MSHEVFLRFSPPVGLEALQSACLTKPRISLSGGNCRRFLDGIRILRFIVSLQPRCKINRGAVFITLNVFWTFVRRTIWLLEKSSQGPHHRLFYYFIIFYFCSIQPTKD